MKKMIKNMENQYLLVVFLVIGILMIIFPVNITVIFPWVLGGGLILRSILIVALSVYYKDSEHKPGYAILYCTMGVVIMVLGGDSIGIIGVIWAVFSIVEVSDEINEMWTEKHLNVILLISGIITVALAIMLMIDPFEHFATHVRVLGLEIAVTGIARCIELIKDRKKPKSEDDGVEESIPQSETKTPNSSEEKQTIE